MWFKNLQIYRIATSWVMSPEQLEEALLPHAIRPASSIELQVQGWAPPRESGSLVQRVGKQLFLSLATEKKLLPASVVNQASKARAGEIEEQQGYAPGRKQMREIKEDMTNELLPRAFSIHRKTAVWIDPVNGWVVIDAASSARSDEVVSLLLKSVARLPLTALRVNSSTVQAMTHWLASDQAPAGFTIDQDAELKATGENKAAIRYVKHTPDAEDVRKHISTGKQCTRLAMTWSDRISFVLTESLAIKRIAALDILKENDALSSSDSEERFETDMVLMTGELSKLMFALVESLGGEIPEKIAARQAP